jgi:hypothetical protein
MKHARAFGRSPLLPLAAALMALVGLILSPGGDLVCTRPGTACDTHSPFGTCTGIRRYGCRSAYYSLATTVS